MRDNRPDDGFVQTGRYCNKPINSGYRETITPDHQLPKPIDYNDSVQLTEEYMEKSYSFAPKKRSNHSIMVKVNTSLVLVNSNSPVHIHKYFMRMKKLKNGKPISSVVNKDDVVQMIQNFGRVKECSELLDGVYWSDFVSILYSKTEFASQTFIVIW